MACSSLKCGPIVSGLNDTFFSSKIKGAFGFTPSFGVMQIGGGGGAKTKSKAFPVLSFDFLGKPLVFSNPQKGFRDWRSIETPTKLCVHAQASICVSRASRWWEKTLKTNMVEIHSAQELVHNLLNAGDRLVVVDFYSPGCGGCRTLHPKICQLAELNANALFLKVNYEKLKIMCYSLNIHVLPFFRFYRGAEGRLCSFSCTNATIKKFKDALAKHGTDRDGLGPAKGLDESEILKLISAGELPLEFPLPATKDGLDLVMDNIDLPDFWSQTGSKLDLKEETAIA